MINNLFVWFSQTLSLVVGYDPNFTFSQNTAFHFVEKGGIGFVKVQMKIIDTLFFWEKDHCMSSIIGHSTTKSFWYKKRQVIFQKEKISVE
jgi:hypothetical protein